ncbi:DUF2207 domain-containing protein [Bifidobacterium sp. CP2]|uniref:DUF2207 domain-containing protein n=1 Tax=Bifidobacterium sp. CP2 TaxID=2809025 RepID=UPI001BDCC0A1|nr:DUF2207 domain-containing protein [Bifidobacterium sp. CP2]MBT1182148.1 DUF2207 domain-containing protein [Bifidobacterium sp. CP2]
MGRNGGRRRAGRIDKAGVGLLAGGALGLLLCVALVAVMLWIIVATARDYLFPATPGYDIERIDVTAHLRTNGDLVVTQTERLAFPRTTDGFDIPLPLSTATADQLKERGVEDTGLTVDMIRDDTHGITYTSADDGGGSGGSGGSGVASARTFSTSGLFRTASVNGVQPRGRSTWTVRYTLDDNALTWSDAGELIWRYGRAFDHQPVPTMHVVLVFDGSLDGEKATSGRNLSAQVAEDYRATTAISAGRGGSGGGSDSGKATVTIDTSLAGGRTGTLHAMFPRDWIADSSMPEPTGTNGDSGDATRMAAGIALDRRLADDLGRTRVRETAVDLAWRLPLAVSLVFLVIAAAKLLRRRLLAPRPLSRDKYSDEPILVDEPWLLTGLVGHPAKSCFFAAALMKATFDGTIRIIDPRHGFPEPDGAGRSVARRAWRLHYDGPVDHDPNAPRLPMAAVNAICGCDGIERHLENGVYQNVAEPFYVPAQVRGFDANPTMMDAWAKRGERLCAGMTKTAGRASSEASGTTGWIVSTGVAGRFVGVVMGIGLVAAALAARLHTDDWTGFRITCVAAVLGMVCCMFLRAYTGDGVDLAARARAIVRWFEERRWEEHREERREEERAAGRRVRGGWPFGSGMRRRRSDDGPDAVTNATQARGLLLDAVALDVDEKAIASFAGHLVSAGVLAGDDPAVWWCSRNGRHAIPAKVWGAVYASCSTCDSHADTSTDVS